MIQLPKEGPIFAPLAECADKHRGAVFGVVGGVGGILQAWHSRGTLSPDLINYLALARVLLANGWNSSISGYWSPLYSWLLAVPMSSHLVTSGTELIWVHIINLGIFFAAMLCFHVYLNHALRLAAIHVGPKLEAWARVETLWYFTACAIFLFAIFDWLPNSVCTPDLLVASFFFLSTGFFVSILCRDRTWPDHFVLGAALALGYLAKAAAFPLAILFLVMLAVINRREKWGWAKCLVTVAAFALVAGPFLLTLSKKEGHPTFGESGRVNILMFSEGIPAFWLGEAPANDTRSPDFERVCTEPPVYALKGTLPGTYLPSYEPSRWYAELVPRFNPRQELRNLLVGERILAGMVTAESDLVLGFVLLILLSGTAKGLRSAFSWWFLWLPALCGTAMFLVVHLEERFISPFVIVGSVGLYTGVLISCSRKPRLAAKVLMALLVVQGCRAGMVVLKGFGSTTISNTMFAEKIVTEIGRAGFPPGGRMAIIGNLGPSYWHWMGQYSTVAEIPVSGTETFLWTAAANRLSIYNCLARAGAQAVFVQTEYSRLLEHDWHRIEGDLYMRMLDKDAAPQAHAPSLRSDAASDRQSPSHTPRNAN